MKTKHYLLIAGIVLVTIACFIIFRSCNGPKPEINAAADSLQYYKNKEGQEVAAKKQLEADFARVDSKWKDSIAKLHNTTANYLQEIVALTQKGKVKIPTAEPPTIVYRDTGSVVSNSCPEIDWVDQEFKNPWYAASVHIPLNGDSSTIDLETFDTLRVVAKTVKEGGLFNRQTYLQVDAVNTNPYNHIQGLSVYRKPLPKPKKIGIGPQIGFGFSNSLKPSLYVGIGAQFSIIRL